VTTVVLDAGAVTAWAEGDPRLTALLTVVAERNGRVIVPTVVIAESLSGNGSRDAKAHRRLKGAVSDPCEKETAVRAAALRSAVRHGRGLAIDAIVVATAEQYGATLLTGDREDIAALVSAGAPHVRVIPLDEVPSSPR
jgi:predicted nucleic acid-binding protein